MLNIKEKAINELPHGFYIPIKPKILTQLQRLMRDNEAILADFAKVIAKDVSLSAEVLMNVNSALFSLETKITDIQHAVFFIGKDAINSLATAILFRRSFTQLDCCLTLERFWDDSKDIAYAMTFINQQLLSPLSGGDLYTIGLFHDCGIPAFSHKFSDYRETLIKANRAEENSIALEENKYEVNHAMVGYLIAMSWHLPEQVCNIILHHHDINFLASTANTHEKLGYATLKLAENLVYRNKRHSEAPDWGQVKSDVLTMLEIDMDDYLELEKYYSSLIL